MNHPEAHTHESNNVRIYSSAQLEIINKAIGILESRISKVDTFSDSASVKRYCQLHLAGEPDENFGCLFLDNQHRLIEFAVMFKGTVDGAAVYPRPIVRKALDLNAAALIFTHNHPSGTPKPSQADHAITQRLRDALSLVDIRVLDHIVVGVEGVTSLAEFNDL